MPQSADPPTSPTAPTARPGPVGVVLVAAGRGSRARAAGDDRPKQYRHLAGLPVLTRTLDALLAHPEIGPIVTVIHPDDRALYDEAVAALGRNEPRLLTPVIGGDERQSSVRSGLEALVETAPALVLVHDAVRPFLSGASIDAALLGLAHHDAVVVGVPVIDTVKRVDAAGTVVETIPREGLWRAATPQGFRFDAILTAHRRAQQEGALGLTDDAAVAEWAGHLVRMVACDEGNVKLTTPDDFAAAERRLAAERLLALPDVRTGLGYDVHSLEPGDAVVLGGIRIPHDHRLKGHSDADVALHALTDAILGAIGDGDIGQHFPPSDERWRGVASAVFLEDAVRRVTERGGIIAHCDITIIAEAPKVGPHRDAMRAEIARLCHITVDRVGVKATTNEGLGFAGRREGIAAMATATVRLPA